MGKWMSTDVGKSYISWISQKTQKRKSSEKLVSLQGGKDLYTEEWGVKNRNNLVALWCTSSRT